MPIEYRDHVAGIGPSQLRGFFVGWPDPPKPARRLEILERSTFVSIAIDAGTEDLVGFITAISDGVLSAYIPLLEVLPSHQGQGIGRALVHRMMARLSHLYMVDLCCDDSLEPFYRPLGFRRATGMVIRNYGRQSAS